MKLKIYISVRNLATFVSWSMGVSLRIHPRSTFEDYTKENPGVVFCCDDLIPSKNLPRIGLQWLRSGLITIHQFQFFVAFIVTSITSFIGISSVHSLIRYRISLKKRGRLFINLPIFTQRKIKAGYNSRPGVENHIYYSSPGVYSTMITVFRFHSRKYGVLKPDAKAKDNFCFIFCTIEAKIHKSMIDLLHL